MWWKGFPYLHVVPAGGSKNLWSAGSGVGAKWEKKEGVLE
jgi:hypothetical protein